MLKEGVLPPKTSGLFVQAKDMLEFGSAVRSYHAETVVSVEPGTSSERQVLVYATDQRVPRPLQQGPK